MVIIILPAFNCVTFHWNCCEISKFCVFLPTTLKAQYSIHRLHNIAENEHNSEEKEAFIVLYDSANKRYNARSNHAKK